MRKIKSSYNPVGIALAMIIVGFSVNPLLGIFTIVIVLSILKKNPKIFTSYFTENAERIAEIKSGLSEINLTTKANEIQGLLVNNPPLVMPQFMTPKLQLPLLGKKIRLERKKKYLHIALNNSLDEAEEIISQLPVSERILIEAGTPLIKVYGTRAVSQIKMLAPAGSYIVADSKCSDLAAREVEMMAKAGASAITCLGVAPLETIDSFISECQKFEVDSMIDMMNVEDAYSTLKKLKQLPNVVMLHRGVDETEFSKEKQIPYYQIKMIKGSFNVLVAVAGGDTLREVQRAIFNDADIVVVWKNFYQASSETAGLAQSFLKEI